MPFSTTASGSGDPSKVAIPRLPQKRKEPPRKASAGRQDRVSRACLSCRARKIKCNGATPRCAHCRDNASSCVYASSRKDRLKTATCQNQDMVALLRDLRAEASGGAQSRIDNLLTAVVDDVADAAANIQRSPESFDEVHRDEARGEADVSAEVGSSGDLDLVDEDLLQGATGFIGKASEIQWLRKLHTDGGNDRNDGPYGPPGPTAEAATERLAALRHRQVSNPLPLMLTSKASYYLDDEILETDFMVDPYELPPFETAERLMQAYMESCHNSFPFLSKKVFTSEFYRYFAALRRGNPYNPPQKWQATLNLVFAIGAVYSHLIAAEWQEDERDHLMYYSRATALGLKDPSWFSYPDLPQMQITGLLSFYYLTVGRVSRAWILIGLAMRFGYALGLHLRNEDRSAGIAKKEVFSRIWWAHFSFERLVSATIGRPSLGVDKNCSVPLPLPVPSADIEGTIIESRFGDQVRMSAGQLHQNTPSLSGHSPESATRTVSDAATSTLEPANSGSYLKSIVQLFEITQEALHLYDASTVSDSWESTQRIISRLNGSLDLWATSLPDGFNFANRRPNVGHQYKREQKTLEVLYHNTKILITRPCLCRLDCRIAAQSARSNDFNQKGAVACVASAKAIANLLPEDPKFDVVALYEAGPWWSITHHIMQSLVVLLLEVSSDATHFPNDRQDIIPSLKKLVRWLRAMRANNGMARRAYSIIINLLKQLVATINFDISDLLCEDDEANTAAAAASVSPPPLEARDTHTIHSHIDKSKRRPMATSFSNPAAQVQAHEHHDQYDAHPYADPFQFPQDPTPYASQAGPSGDAFMDHFPELRSTTESSLPALFFTNFDEQHPLSGDGI